MSYQVLFLYHANHGSHSSTLEFDCPRAAEKAKRDFDQLMERRFGVRNDIAHSFIFPNPPTFRSLFKEMLKANPYGDIKEMMAKAKEAIKVMEEKTLDEI